MLKCANACPCEFDRCCHKCELREFCESACQKDPKRCSYFEENEELRFKAKTRKKRDKFWRIYIIFFIMTASVLIIGLSIIGNQNFIMMQNTDILNQQNTIVQELDKQSIDGAAENRSQNESEALTTEEFDLVCRIVAAEARGESLQGMMAVAQTIMDRSELWNMTLSEVVRSPGQYADPYPDEISDDVKLAVANVFSGGVRVFDQPTTHFYSGDKPYWADEKINRGSVGRHEFLY